MDSHGAALTVEAVAWCDEAAAMLADAVPFGCVADLAAQAEAGAVLFRVSEGGRTAAYYLLRVDHNATGAEGVMVAAAGRAGVDLTRVVLPVAEKQFKGCHSMRIHTARPGLARKLARAGYGNVELVLRKKL